MKKFRTRFDDTIEEYEVVKETNSQVVYINTRGAEQRESKVSDWQAWHNTKEEAINHLIEKQNIKIRHCEQQIKIAENKIQQIKTKFL